MFYDHMTGELTKLGKQYGFPEGGAENYEKQYKEALLRYERDTANAKCEVDAPRGYKCEYEETGKCEVLAEDVMYDMATTQCGVLRPVLQNSQCSDETRKAVIDIVKNILRSFQDTDEIKKRKEQIFLENPDFFPKESALITAKRAIKPHLEQVKSEIQKRRSQKVKPEDRISGTVASDRMVEGIERGIIAKPKNTSGANRQAMRIRKNLGLMLEKNRR